MLPTEHSINSIKSTFNIMQKSQIIIYWCCYYINMLRNSTQKFRQRYNSSNKKTTLNSFTIDSNRQIYQLDSVNTISNIKRSSSTRKIEQKNRNKPNTVRTPISAKCTPKSLGLQLTSLKSWRQSVTQASKLKIFQTYTPLKLRGRQQTQIKKRDPSQFIENLPKNTIFFCCQCYQYVFEIQKKRHFPDCKDAPSLQLKGKQLNKYIKNKMDKILQLSRYTGTKTMEVEKIYNQIGKEQYWQISLIKYPTDCLFFSLEQILEAFAFTSDKLLQNPIDEKSTLLNCF